MAGGENVVDIFDSLSGQVQSLLGAETRSARNRRAAQGGDTQAGEHLGLNRVGAWMKLDARRASDIENQEARMHHRASPSERVFGGGECMASGPGRAPGGGQQQASVADNTSSRGDGAWHGFARRKSAGSRPKDLPLVHVPAVTSAALLACAHAAYGTLTTANTAPHLLSGPAGKFAREPGIILVAARQT